MKKEKFDLEHFPTSGSAQKMLSYVSDGFYDKSYIGKWLYQVMGLEYDKVLDIIEELPVQFFPETATWGLMYHEIKWGLPVRLNLSDEERRSLIYQKRDCRAPMTPYRMEKYLENVTNFEVHIADANDLGAYGFVPSHPNVFKAYFLGEGTLNSKLVHDVLNKLKQSHTIYIVNDRIEIGFNNVHLEQIRIACIFILYIPFWGDDIYTGPYCYDGTLLYDAVRKYKIGLLIRCLLHTKTQQYVAYRQSRIKAFIQGREYANLSLQNLYSISFWGCSVYNGQERYNGSVLYNALRNYKVCIMVRNYIGILTLQRIVCSRNRTRAFVQNRMQTDLLLYFPYRIKQREFILKAMAQHLVKLNVVEEINHNSQVLSMQVLHKNILNIWHRCKGKVKNNRPKIVNKIKIQMDINNPCGQIGNMQIITSRNVARYDGTLHYDGTAKYDALYKEERVE